MATVGGFFSLSFLIVVMLAPVRVLPLQIAAIALVTGVAVYVFRMSKESVSIEHRGIAITPAFGRAAWVSWDELIAVDSASHSPHPKSSDTQAHVAGLWDLDEATPSREVRTFSLVTNTNRVVPLPVSDDRTLGLIQEAWSLATRVA